MNKIASVLLISKIILLIRPQSIAIFADFIKISCISLTVFPGAKKAISSTNNKAVISGISVSILSNIPERYIMNKIDETGDPYRIPAFIFLKGHVNPSITN